MMLGADHKLDLGTVANQAFDYVALGHVHKHQVLSRHPLVVYSGSLQRIDFSEEKDAKGFCVFDLDHAKPRGERVSGFSFELVEARPMLTVEVRVRDGDDPTEATLKEIVRHHGDGLEGAIVRVRVEMGQAAEPGFREDAIRHALAPAHYVSGIERQVRREHRTRLDLQGEASLLPEEALRRYLRSRNVPEERERLVMEHGEQLIREEMES